MAGYRGAMRVDREQLPGKARIQKGLKEGQPIPLYLRRGPYDSDAVRVK